MEHGLKKFFFFFCKIKSWQLCLLPIIPEAVRKIILIRTLIHRIVFSSLFFFAGDNNLSNQSFDSPPKSPFKDFPGSRTEAWWEEKETDFNNSFVDVYFFIFKGRWHVFCPTAQYAGSWLFSFNTYLHNAPITLIISMC